MKRSLSYGVLGVGGLALAAVFALTQPRVKSRLPFFDEPEEGVCPVSASVQIRETYKNELRQVNQKIDFRRRNAEAQSKGWKGFQALSGLYLRRVRLTGDDADYGRAQEAVDAIRERGGGYRMIQAKLDVAVGRFDDALEVLQVLEANPTMDRRKRAAVIGLRADIDLRRGRYKDARSGIQEALALHRSTETLARLAAYQWKTGDFDRAADTFDRAESHHYASDGYTPAWFDLQRGRMARDRGRYDEAMAHYIEADDHLKGWWLVEAHIAEVLDLKGEHEKAERRYRALIEETGDPAFMDGLARILIGSGRQDEARPWIERARKAWIDRLSSYPEATWERALEHFLAFEPASPFTLDMARKNFALQPGGEAAILLARAHLRAGHIEEAQALIEQVRATPFRSARLHQVAADVFSAAGLGDLSARERRLALALNPHLID